MNPDTLDISNAAVRLLFLHQPGYLPVDRVCSSRTVAFDPERWELLVAVEAELNDPGPLDPLRREVCLDLLRHLLQGAIGPENYWIQ